MKAETQLIKAIIKEIVFENHNSEILEILGAQKIDWQRLKYLIFYHEIGPFLYSILKDNLNLIPEDFLNFLKTDYYSRLSKYMFLWDEFLRIIKEAKKKDILIVPIKGLSFSEKLYKRFGFRPIVDIDLLIKEEQLEIGIKLLEGMGYKKHLLGKESYWRSQQCHLAFIKFQGKTRLLVELHWTLDFKRGKIEVIPSLWNKLNPVFIENEQIYTLSPEDTLFSLALHQRRFGKMLNLKYICDAGLIIKMYNLEWNYIYEVAHQERILASLFFLLYQTDFVLNMGIEKYLRNIKISNLHKKLICHLIKKYTFLPPTEFKLDYLYLMCHLLLYDTFLEPIRYIFNIPQEQFAKFYKLPLYNLSTKILYHLRAVYIPYKLTEDLLKFFKVTKLKGRP